MSTIKVLIQQLGEYSVSRLLGRHSPHVWSSRRLHNFLRLQTQCFGHLIVKHPEAADLRHVIEQRLDALVRCSKLCYIHTHKQTRFPLVHHFTHTLVSDFEYMPYVNHFCRGNNNRLWANIMSSTGTDVHNISPHHREDQSTVTGNLVKFGHPIL